VPESKHKVKGLLMKKKTNPQKKKKKQKKRWNMWKYCYFSYLCYGHLIS